MACGASSGSESDGSQVYSSRTFYISGNELACVEYTAQSEADQTQIELMGAIPGSCSQSMVLGTCEQSSTNQSYTSKTIYYSDDSGLRTVQSLKEGCEYIQGVFTLGEAGSNDSSSSIVERTYIIQNNDIACTEHISSTQIGQSQIVAIGGIEGSCSRLMSLGVCQQSLIGEINSINTVYYADDAGLRTAESLVSGCEHIQGNFIFSDDGEVSKDTTAPLLTEELAIGTADTYTPSYSFNSTETGTIIYAGQCLSSTTLANSGTNTVIFNPLAAGVYANCTIQVQDDAGNQSSVLNISSFTISDTTGPAVSQLSAIEKSYIKQPVISFTSNEAGTIHWAGSCSSAETTVVLGLNNIELMQLDAGVYDDCSFIINDTAGNSSEIISIALFSIVILDTDADGFTDFVETEYGSDALDENSTPIDLLLNIVDFSDDNDNDGFSDEIEAWLDTDPNNTDKAPEDQDGDFIPDGFNINSDDLAPRLLAFAIATPNITIETGNEVVSFYLTVVDDVSGVDRVEILLTGPTGQTVYLSEYGSSLGNKLHALSVKSSEFGEFAEAGAWRINYVRLADIAANYKEYNSTALETLGFEANIVVENEKSDLEPPVLNDFSIVEESIEIVTGQETVLFNLTVTDSVSGVDRVDLVLESPTGQTVYLSKYGPSLGQNSHTLLLESSEFGSFSEEGTWFIRYVNLADIAGNSKRYSSSDLTDLAFESNITIQNEQSDITPPTLNAFSIVEETVEILTGSETVSFNMTVADTSSGVDRIEVVLKGSTGQTVYLSEYGSSLGQNSHTVILESSEFGEFAEAGIWTIEYVRLTDVAGNYKQYSSSDLNVLTFEKEIEIINL